MFETQDFRQQLIRAIRYETATLGAEKYEDSIIDFLQNLAVANESDPGFLARGEHGVRFAVADATQSASRLIAQAIVYTRERGDREVTLEDVQKAYRARYCKYWPFCK